MSQIKIIGYHSFPDAATVPMERLMNELTRNEPRELILVRDAVDNTWMHAFVPARWYTDELSAHPTVRSCVREGNLMKISIRRTAEHAFLRHVSKLISPYAPPRNSNDLKFRPPQVDEAEELSFDDFFDAVEEAAPLPPLSPAERFLQTHTPAAMEEELNRYVLGQPQLTRAVAEFLYYHALRQTCPDLPQRPLLIAGPSGSGKTEVWRAAKRLYGEVFPIQVVDGSNMTCDGWAGSNKVSTHVTRELANGGILVVDEFDKLARPKHNSKGENISMDMQAEFLKLVEGEYEILENKRPTGKTSSAMGFVLVGAFEDIHGEEAPEESVVRPIGFLAPSIELHPIPPKGLTDEDFVAYGIMPELVGRIAAKCCTQELSMATAIAIVRSPHSRVSRIAQVLKKRGVAVEALMSDAELEALIHTSRKNRTGMRWVSAQVESRLLEAIYTQGVSSEREEVLHLAS